MTQQPRSRPTERASTERRPASRRPLTTAQLGKLHDDLRQRLRIETDRAAELEAAGLPPPPAHDLIEMADSISRALRKIDDGTYGGCERCGRPIPYARLEAVPYASRCVDCQARQGSLLEIR